MLLLQEPTSTRPWIIGEEPCLLFKYIQGLLAKSPSLLSGLMGQTGQGARSVVQIQRVWASQDYSGQVYTVENMVKWPHVM